MTKYARPAVETVFGIPDVWTCRPSTFGEVNPWLYVGYPADADDPESGLDPSPPHLSNQTGWAVTGEEFSQRILGGGPMV